MNLSGRRIRGGAADAVSEGHLGGFWRNVATLLGGQVSRLAVQAVYFVLLARVLEPSAFGLAAAIMAVGALASPFAALGLNTIMVRNVARNGTSIGSEWKRSLTYTAIGGTALSLLLSLLVPVIIQTDLHFGILFIILLTDLVGLRLIDLSAALWHTVGSSRQLALMPTVMNLLRMAAVILFALIVDVPSLNSWALFYLASTLPLGLVLSAITSWRLRGGKWKIGASMFEIKDGVLFSISLSSQSAFNDIDKTMLANLQSASSAGLYTAAYRIVDMAYAPIRSIAAAAYPRLFRAGGTGLNSTMVLVKKIAPMVIGFGILGSLGLFFLAPYSTILLGEDYQGSVEIISFLAPLVLLRGISFLAADALSSSGLHGYRTAVQVGLVAVNVVLNLLLIPSYGVLGAVVSTLICEVILSLALWVRIAYGLRKADR
ncbi:oligosaccharide flippase family protein [Arthrobacter sp. Bz4]|uniref:oligosaccharide flippase family protein n=1 Tax=Arthrobacter sp. Bz4 TaxID=2171979 RepID=UPI000D50B27B|nr:oligosaccharide flippase family protein [Arthrobacter sp. Bz4]PVE14652.1 hypothetical protein DDA93_15780 [Arthrobacter sp. Bz4]